MQSNENVIKTKYCDPFKIFTWARLTISDGGIPIEHEPHFGPYNLRTTPNIVNPMQFDGVDYNIPVKVTLTKDFSLSNKAFFFKKLVAMRTFQAFQVPSVVKNFENESIEYHHVATDTFGNCV